MDRNKARNCGKQKAFALNDFIESIYLPNARLRKRSWETDERIARLRISPVLGKMGIDAITQADVESWLDGLLASGISPASCNRFLAALKSIFSLAERRGAIQHGASPCKGVRFLKTGEARERFLSLREGLALMECLAKANDIRASAIQMLLLTGARKSEIFRARWENVDFERRILKVPLAKSGKTRFIALSGEALKVLAALPKNSPWVFPGRDISRPMADPYRFWNRIRRKSGIPDVRIHDLRHSFASFLVNGGHSLYEVQKLLGHASPRTTMRYAHLAWDSLLAATDDVGKCLSAKGLAQ